jgi:hypothetical protein
MEWIANKNQCPNILFCTEHPKPAFYQHLGCWLQPNIKRICGARPKSSYIQLITAGFKLEGPSQPLFVAKILVLPV